MKQGVIMHNHLHNPWLFVLGMTGGGIKALSEEAKNIIANADVIIGPQRYLMSISLKETQKSWTYPTPFITIIEQIKEYKKCNPENTFVILATGDPMHFGIGSTLIKYFKVEDIYVIPQLSAFTLAASRLLWPLAECVCVSLHGRDIETLSLHLLPNQKMLILSHNKHTPHDVYKFLQARGYSNNAITILEYMGYENERVYSYHESISVDDIADFNVIAIECHLLDTDKYLPPLSGIASHHWRHDGKITRQEVRAMALAQLEPQPRMLLWDVGAGAGSVAIDVLRIVKDMRAICIEKNKDNVQNILHNARYFGCHNRLEVKKAHIMDVCDTLEKPDIIFVGGGIDSVENMERIICFLPAQKGRIVAHAVTIQSEHILMQLFLKRGGKLKKIQLSHSDTIGNFSAFRPAMTVTQWCFSTCSTQENMS